jgi:hypothetical protein
MVSFENAIPRGFCNRNDTTKLGVKRGVNLGALEKAKGQLSENNLGNSISMD